MRAARLRDEARRVRAGVRRRARAALLAGGSGTPAFAGANASSAVVAAEQLWTLPELYGDYAIEPIGYGTVRDYADSTANLPGLAAASADMKNLQRCWAVKAVLGNVERGGRLVEIGAGEPLVAGLLTRLGYRVTIVDPYDGSGNGPREYAEFTKAYPDVEIIRDQFPPATALRGDVDCVYSISVLEHVPLDAIDAVVAGAEGLVRRTGGCSIHAVDHVLAGWGADSHREGLDRIVAAMGLSAGELAATIEAMELDPDTYLVSAEAHNQWRGALDYDAYPMRRIGSVQLFGQAR
jgi:hypothetical protein